MHTSFLGRSVARTVEMRPEQRSARKMAMVAALRPPEKPYPHHPPRRHRTTKHGVFLQAEPFPEGG